MHHYITKNLKNRLNMHTISQIDIQKAWRPPGSDEEIDCGDEIVNTIIALIRANYSLKAFDIAHILQYTTSALKDYLNIKIGISCVKLRHRLVLADAKWEVLHTTDKIEIISERMHFPTPCAFSNFFRRYTGLSPRKYRCVNQQIEMNPIFHYPDIVL